jgi:HlyD family secretion protein
MEKKRIIPIVGIVFLGSVVLYLIFSNWVHHNEILTLYGNVDIREVDLSFRVGGRLKSLKVDEGDKVREGELIAELDSEPYLREVNAAKAAVNQQKAALAYAETVYAREKKLHGTGASSIDKYQNALTSRDMADAALEKAIADLSQANLRLQDTVLFSPSNGVVLTRAIEPGTMLSQNSPVITVSLTSPVWVRAYISEKELGNAKPGTKVKVYTDSNPDKFYDGQIGFVSPTAEFTPKTVETTDLRTELVYRLRIIMQDPKNELRQGMPVTVKLHHEGRDDVNHSK